MTERSIQQRNLLGACARGEYDFLEKYIRKNLQKRKYEVFDNHKWGPLHHAVASNSYDCVQLLLSSGLVDTRWRSFEGQTCLFVAVDRGASQAIIKSLLKTDMQLFNMPNNESVYPIHKAVLKDCIETVRTMVETLTEMRVTIPDQFDWDLENSLFLAARAKNRQMVEYLLTAIKCDLQHENESGLNAATVALLPCDGRVEDEELNRLEIVKRLIPLTYDTSAENCVQRMMLPISFTCVFKRREVYQWIMEQFYLSDYNEHRDLVAKALSALQLVDFDYLNIIASLHSKITRLVVRENDQLKNDIFYSNVMQDLRNLFKCDRHLFTDIVSVWRTKVDVTSLNYVVMKFIPSESIEGTEFLNDLIEMFDIIQIGDLLSIPDLLIFTPSIPFFNNLLLLFMPFSTEITANVYLEHCVRKGVIRDTSSYEMDDGLARFSVSLNNSNLKSLCRTVIRTTVFKYAPNGCNNKQKLSQIRNMLLPVPLEKFLRFNYSNYAFR